MTVLAQAAVPPQALRFAPVDLASVPAVDALLVGLGYGSFLRAEVTAAPGRNDIWIGPTTSGRRVFVKRLTGSPDYVRDRLARIEAFERVRPLLAPRGMRAPALLALDADEALCAFAHIDGGVSGAQVATDGSFSDALASLAGRAIGALHAASPDLLDGIESPPLHMPSPEFLIGLPAGMFETLTMAELDSWRLLQQDAQLCEAVDQLCAAEAAAEKVPSHCDLRLDQFLVVGEELHLTDFEEFRLADPARDVGCFVGQWLQRATLDIVAPDQDAVGTLDPDLTHDMVMARGVQNLIRLRPRVEQFWRAYRVQRPEVDTELAVRATAFAGWHLLDRLLASASRTTRVSGIERAAAGIGRSALTHPERFAAALGLGEPS